MRLMLWVILWLGGLGALGLVGRGVLVVVVEVLLRVVGGRCEGVRMMLWRRVRVMSVVRRRWSDCTSTRLNVISF